MMIWDFKLGVRIGVRVVVGIKSQITIQFEKFIKYTMKNKSNLPLENYSRKILNYKSKQFAEIYKL